MLSTLKPDEIEAAGKGLPLRWLDREWPLVQGALRLLVKHHLDADLAVALRDLERYVQMRDLWASWAELAQDMKVAAKRAGEPTFHLVALVMLTDARTISNDAGGAAAVIAEIDAVMAEVNDPLLRAEALNAKGNALRLTRQTGGALACYEQARQLYSELGVPSGESTCAHNIASVHRDLGHYDDAISLYRHDLDFWEAAGDRWQQAWTLNSLGGAYELSGMQDKAIGAHLGAYQIFYEFGDWAGVSRCLNDLGIAMRKSGHTGTALACHMADLELESRLGDARGVAMAFTALGDLTVDIDPSRAEAYLREAVKIAREIADSETEASAVACIARIAVLQGDADRARADRDRLADAPRQQVAPAVCAHSDALRSDGGTLRRNAGRVSGRSNHDIPGTRRPARQ